MALSAKQLGYFVALAEEANFGRAAAKAHVSQPALSVQIKALETALGTRLVERLPREVRLTRTGQEVLVRARRILAEMGDLEQAVRWREGLAGQLTLGVIPTVAPYLLPPALARLRARDLTLDMRVREAQTQPLLEALARGRLDAAVVALPVGNAGFAAVELLRDRFLLAGSRPRVEAWRGRAARLVPSEVTADELLVLDEGHCLAGQALDVCGLAGRGPVDLGATSLATLCGLVAEGLGLTLLPELAVRTEAAATPDLALMRFAAPEPERRLALVRRAGPAGAWVEELAGILREAGETLVAAAATAIPREGGIAEA